MDLGEAAGMILTIILRFEALSLVLILEFSIGIISAEAGKLVEHSFVKLSIIVAVHEFGLLSCAMINGYFVMGKYDLSVDVSIGGAWKFVEILFGKFSGGVVEVMVFADLVLYAAIITVIRLPVIGDYKEIILGFPNYFVEGLMWAPVPSKVMVSCDLFFDVQCKCVEGLKSGGNSAETEAYVSDLVIQIFLIQEDRKKIFEDMVLYSGWKFQFNVED
ncbi:hypothetical protein M5K25_027610 [Dendrobium thyrsiflorum]|uniref:Uncharacterized protein n=1 Tax=Dendrobium thyrsiflorum TaxID=117978 RepID=A0ABD0TUA5_DENTH